ncbi:alpha amylase catalytic region [Paenibacillus curdlanolyticus YK9]|uniref:Alpha-amylase n=1 Tax=Paenibacillus curdlanolyticus YK9 TaxID=717606 RepID=E0IEX7_9BACL|nr:alpha-glucosidase [Paenibacillus curdlanolyticus]EFM08753.1 alpha amylase catalytic region [Paenibacillus curdlanolyticus YK9]
MNQVWWKEAVVYQIYPRSFMDSNGDGIGDLQGIIAKLDYLKELGVDVLWICPFFKSPNDDNGYDISDYQDIMDEFGTMADFDELLKETHARGMKLILDLVINHTSDEHPWFIESRSSVDSPKRDWYIWRDGRDGREPNNWESIFSGSAWEFDDRTGQYYLHIFSVKQPDLNWENAEVREALYDTVNWWLDKGIDGFRVDAISHIKKLPGLPDMPNPDGREYVSSFDGHMNREGIQTHLKELKERTFDKYNIMTVGEANGVSIEQADDWVGEENGKFNMIFQFEHLGLWDRGADSSVDVPALKHTLTKWQKGLENRGWNALFFENHDQARSVSTWGNDREYRVQSAKMLGVCYFFMQGTPYIYQGQELGMTNVRFESIDDYDDVGMKNYYRIETENGRPHEEVMEIIWNRGRDNSRTPMQWSDAPNAGFTTGTPWMGVNPNYSNINVERELADPDSVLNFYKAMARLRKEHSLFVYGTYELLLAEHEQIFAYTRSGEGGKALVICNFSPHAAELHLPAGVVDGNVRLALHNYPVEGSDADANASANALEHCTLRPYEARVYLM